MKIFVFDLDDTLLDTWGTLKKLLKEKFDFDLPEEIGFITPENTNGHATELLESAEFMRLTTLYEELIHLPTWMDTLRKKHGVKFVCCTHRGYHPDAQEHTQHVFDKLGITFDFEFFLCHTTEPNKIDFLNEMLGVGNYALFDDNPDRHGNFALPRNIYIIDKPWNKHYQLHSASNRIKHTDITHVVETLIVNKGLGY